MICSIIIVYAVIGMFAKYFLENILHKVAIIAGNQNFEIYYGC